ncbi:hypothetical protein AACH06_20410 [Ideonella sp. DXS29W]|uniref:Peptidase M4 domain-containing protein n=1 Tax=Ideonella lacteola TaxID=2984193 RepID=A0ABU9BT91_9BURK
MTKFTSIHEAALAVVASLASITVQAAAADHPAIQRALSRLKSEAATAQVSSADTFTASDLIQSAQADGTQFKLQNLSRGKKYVVDVRGRLEDETLFVDSDHVWGNEEQKGKQTLAANTAYNQGVDWDYYKNALGRSGPANDGRGLHSRTQDIRQAIAAVVWRHDGFS